MGMARIHNDNFFQIYLTFKLEDDVLDCFATIDRFKNQVSVEDVCVHLIGVHGDMMITPEDVGDYEVILKTKEQVLRIVAVFKISLWTYSSGNTFSIIFASLSSLFNSTEQSPAKAEERMPNKNKR